MAVLRSVRGTTGQPGTATRQRADVVIATKLSVPRLRQPPVSRRRLLDPLDQALTVPLTLVVAPAGWGKSTVVAQWLERASVPAGWVCIDSGDNDPHRFWRYLLLAAAQAVPTLAGPLSVLEAAGSDVARDVLPVFVNDVVGSGAEVVIVLDDYHLVISRPRGTSRAPLSTEIESAGIWQTRSTRSCTTA